MVIQKEVEGTYFDSAFQTGSASLMTLNQYIGKVKSGEYARPIAYLRGLIKAGKKDEADAYKKKLPLYVAGGVMEGGRKLEHMARYSACIVIDIDDSPIPVLELLRRAAEFPYVKAGHVSPSGTGVKLFIMVDSDLKNHNLAFEIVKHRVEVDLPGVKVRTVAVSPAMIRTLFIRKNLKRSKSPLLTRSLRPLPDIPPEACAPARGFRTTLTSMNKAILLLPVTVIPIL